MRPFTYSMYAMFDFAKSLHWFMNWVTPRSFLMEAREGQNKRRCYSEVLTEVGHSGQRTILLKLPIGTLLPRPATLNLNFEIHAELLLSQT